MQGGGGPNGPQTDRKGVILICKRHKPFFYDSPTMHTVILPDEYDRCKNVFVDVNGSSNTSTQQRIHYRNPVSSLNVGVAELTTTVTISFLSLNPTRIPSLSTCFSHTLLLFFQDSLHLASNLKINSVSIYVINNYSLFPANRLSIL